MESNKINLIGSSNNIFAKYPLNFWIIIIVIILSISALFYVNNFSQSSQNKILDKVSLNAEKLEGLFHNIESDSAASISSLLAIYKNDIYFDDSEKFISIAEKTINTLYSPLINNNKLIMSYFYVLNSSSISKPVEKMYDNTGNAMPLDIKCSDGDNFIDYISEIKEPSWEICVSNTGESLVSYIIPLDGLGVVGIVLSADTLFEFTGESDYSIDKYPFLLSGSNGAVISKNSISDSTKQALVNFDYSSSGVVSFDSNDLTFYYVKIIDKLFYMEAFSLVHTNFLSNVYIFCLGFAALVCVWITQSDRLNGANFYEFMTQKLFSMLLPQNQSVVTLNSYMSALAIQISLLLALFFQFLLSLMAYDAPIISLFYLIVLLVSSLGFLLYRKATLDSIPTYIFVFFVTVTPMVMHFILGGYESAREPYETFWFVCSIVTATILLSRKMSRITFALTVIMIVISLVIEMIFYDSVSTVEIVAFSMNIILVCTLIFSAIEIYYNNTKRDVHLLKEETIQIKETQSAFVHKEKMVTLGQLIAGVAHEINTPIGAVKAAGETLEGMTDRMLTRIISETKDYSKEDLEAFIQIVNICISSIKEMRSTMETRKAKAAIREYFKSAGLSNYAELTNLATKLEICDLEKIDDNLDLFFNPKITNFLQIAAVVMPFLNGTQTVIFASNRVAKIVFALKAFAHTSSSSEFIWYDIVRSIENIIILYHNQIKAGVEIVQDYDDNIPDLYGNPDEIGQVWTNLVQNAIYAMSGVGTLKISIHNEDNKMVKISFTDTGSGIKEENLKNIFEPFFTTKPLGEGSGLGLDICKKIINKHDGDISVSSKLGTGTTFTICLPIKDKE